MQIHEIISEGLLDKAKAAIKPMAQKATQAAGQATNYAGRVSQAAKGAFNQWNEPENPYEKKKIGFLGADPAKRALDSTLLSYYVALKKGDPGQQQLAQALASGKIDLSRYPAQKAKTFELMSKLAQKYEANPEKFKGLITKTPQTDATGKPIGPGAADAEEPDPLAIPPGQRLRVRSPRTGSDYFKTNKGWFNDAPTPMQITNQDSIDRLEAWADAGAGKMERIPQQTQIAPLHKPEQPARKVSRKRGQ